MPFVLSDEETPDGFVDQISRILAKEGDDFSVHSILEGGVTFRIPRSSVQGNIVLSVRGEDSDDSDESDIEEGENGRNTMSMNVVTLVLQFWRDAIFDMVLDQEELGLFYFNLIKVLLENGAAVEDETPALLILSEFIENLENFDILKLLLEYNATLSVSPDQVTEGVDPDLLTLIFSGLQKTLPKKPDSDRVEFEKGSVGKIEACALFSDLATHSASDCYKRYIEVYAERRASIVQSLLLLLDRNIAVTETFNENYGNDEIWIAAQREKVSRDIKTAVMQVPANDNLLELIERHCTLNANAISHLHRQVDQHAMHVFFMQTALRASHRQAYDFRQLLSIVSHRDKPDELEACAAKSRSNEAMADLNAFERTLRFG